MIFALIALFIIQFFKIDHSNPAVIQENDFIYLTKPPQPIQAMLKNACYDCHSDETKYPWYTDYQPIGWWVKGHIKGGKKHLNFSRWGTYQSEKRNFKIDECIEEIKENHMPLKSYTWTHDDAKLDENQKKQLITWLQTIMVLK